jgi:hypothetical protein
MAQVLLTQECVPVVIEMYLWAVDNINTIKKSTGTVMDARKEAGLEVKKAKCILMCHHENAGQESQRKHS